MYVKIGPYKDYLSVYCITDKLKFFGVSECKCDDIGDYLSDVSYVKNFFSFLNSIFGKRKIKVKIDNYDTWSMDSTLAYIIVPMLKQLKENNHGIPAVNNNDVPENLKFDDREAFDEVKLKAKWDYVMDEMIWAFSQVNDEDVEDQFYSGVRKREFVLTNPDAPEEERVYEMTVLEGDTWKFDDVGYDEYVKRMNNGFRLFGIYYRNLWD